MTTPDSDSDSDSNSASASAKRRLYAHKTYAPTERLEALLVQVAEEAAEDEWSKIDAETHPVADEQDIVELWREFVSGCASSGFTPTLHDFADWITIGDARIEW